MARPSPSWPAKLPNCPTAAHGARQSVRVRARPCQCAGRTLPRRRIADLVARVGVRVGFRAGQAAVASDGGDEALVRRNLGSGEVQQLQR